MAVVDSSEASADTASRGSALEVFWVALRLGLTSFGGPVAHLGYFREEYVRRRRWLDDAAYADLVALCQFLPGPASSQVGIAIGTLRAGWIGGLLAFLGFTLPSAIAMILFAYGLATFDVADAGWLHGLKVAAVAVVANALWGMAPGLAAGRVRAAIAIGAACVVLAVPLAAAQVAVIVIGGVAGWWLLGVPGGVEAAGRQDLPARGRRVAAMLLVAFFVLLVLLPIVRAALPSQLIAMIDVNYRVGSLVFGGGHVVLPLLQTEVVPTGWVAADAFIAGYGAAQAVPGPLFTFAAFLGAAQGPSPNGWLGAAVALGAIYVPSFLLVWGALPFWDRLRAISSFQAALRGMGAAVVGILLAALYDPVWTSAILGPRDFALAVVCFGMLAVWRVPPWAVVVVAAAGGAVLAL
jgi:chromate transporter